MDSPRTTSDYITLLGGTFAAARALGVSPKRVSNWKKTGSFPRREYAVIRDAVFRCGHDVPLSLFNMRNP